MQLTKNFNLQEFKCKDGSLVPHYYVSNVMYLAIQLQKIHDLFNLDWLRINSGYRTESHNKNVGGSKNSFHLYAKAVDISQQCINVKKFHSLLLEAVKLGFIPDGEILLYDTFVHYAPQFDLKHVHFHYGYDNNLEFLSDSIFSILLKNNKSFVKKCRTHDFTPF